MAKVGSDHTCLEVITIDYALKEDEHFLTSSVFKRM